MPDDADWDKRRAPRKDVFGHALIVAPGLRKDCVIRNLSASGAKLAVSSQTSLPDEFDLVLLKTNSTRRVSLRWRHGDFVGVQFWQGDKAPAPAPRPRPTAGPSSGFRSSWRGFHSE
jgi:hypothetical protein